MSNCNKLYKPLRRAMLLIYSFLFAALTFSGFAATFLGNAMALVSDPSGNLSWNPTANALTVECWFKLSVPTGTSLADNMTIIANGNTGTQSAGYAYAVYFNINSGNVEFAVGGTSTYTNTLITRPYLERWYHVAIVQQASAIVGYLDGRQVFFETVNVGNTRNTAGLSIGGWGAGQYLYGEVQEVAVYQTARKQDFILQYLYSSQPTNNPGYALTGYFPLGYSTNISDELHNFAASAVGDAICQGGGNINFEAVDKAGEQSTFDANRNGGRDALVPLSGAFCWQHSAFSRPTPGVALNFVFGYSSANSFGGFQLGNNSPYTDDSMGSGWRHTFETCLIRSDTFSPFADADTIGLLKQDGSIETWDFDEDTGDYATRSLEYDGEIIPSSTNYQWITPERLVYTFRRPDSGTNFVMRGKLTSIRDYNGNSIQLLYDQGGGVLTQVVDTVLGKYNFAYSSSSLLTNVSFGAWQLNFKYDRTNRLISQSITNTSGSYSNVSTVSQFSYDTNGLLAAIIDPGGSTNVAVQYDQYGRKTNLVDAIGRSTRTEYGVPAAQQIRNTDPGGFAWITGYDRKGHIVSQQDPIGNITRYTYDSFGNRTSIIEPLGYQTFFAYDNRANVIVRTNAVGQVDQWIMHPFFNKAVEQIDAANCTNFFLYDDVRGNLLSHYDSYGAMVNYTYLPNGLLRTATDGNGNTSSMTYDTNGFLALQTDAASNTTLFFNNEVGWKLAQTNALGQVTTFAYDLAGRILLTTDPLLRHYARAYDANGNLLSQTDAKGLATTYQYDSANQKIASTDRIGARTTYGYDLRGNLVTTTNAIGLVTTQVYDAANHLTSTIDPLGNAITNVYDANARIITFVDKAGQVWSKGYDRLNRLTSETDPLGNTKRTVYDNVGRVAQVISANGFPSVNQYDGRGRLTNWIDPNNFNWQYDYDAAGNLTNITDALGGHYVMTYGYRNERLTERNQDSFTWRYTYDPLLRLATEEDPNQVVRTCNYDAGGRLTTVGFSTGRTNLTSFDINNNPTNLVRIQSGSQTTLNLTYDSLDRVTNQYDTVTFQNVSYVYDALGRITNLVYPAGKILTQRFDALSRLTNQTDWVGHQVAYRYDVADRMVSRFYPNGVTQTNSFDSAGRLTGLSFLTNNSAMIALTYAYDRNGNKTRSTEIGTLDWPIPSLSEDKSTFTGAGRLINRYTTQSGNTNSAATMTYHYDASGNMTNAADNTQSYTLSYDEDNRVVALTWDCGLTSKNIANRYDGLGRRLQRIQDGSSTGYVLDLSQSMERVLCDLNSDGTITYYIHGPDLCYEMDQSGNVTCFHSDAVANVISLTDGTRNIVAQYVYTPYGRVLSATNGLSLSNSYQFVGAQGVMNELPGLYFMRARYYSADAGAFLSTDPVKNIGPTWEPVPYCYASGSPLRWNDPKGELNQLDGVLFLASAGASTLGAFAHDVTEATLELGGVSPRHAQGVTDVAWNSADAMSSIGDSMKLAAGTLSPRAYGDELAGSAFGDMLYHEAVPNFLNLYLQGIMFEGDALSPVFQPLFKPKVVSASKSSTSIPAASTPSRQNITGGNSLSSATPAAIGHAASLSYATIAPPTLVNVSLAPKYSESSSIGNVSHPVQPGTVHPTPGTSLTSVAQSFVNHATTTIGNIVNTIGGFFSGLFGGGHK